MGMFKDMRTLSKQGRDIQQHTDVKATMADGLAKMQAATAMMTQQATAVNGVPATATIVAVRPTSTVVNMAPVVEIDLTVIRNGMPMPVTHREAVPQAFLGRLQPGANLQVKVDPANPTSVWIDWAG
jgi:hypothetical protein